MSNAFDFLGREVISLCKEAFNDCGRSTKRYENIEYVNDSEFFKVLKDLEADLQECNKQYLDKSLKLERCIQLLHILKDNYREDNRRSRGV